MANKPRPNPEPISKDEAERWRRKDLWAWQEAVLLLWGYLPTDERIYWVDTGAREGDARELQETDDDLQEAEDAIHRAVAAGYLRRFDLYGLGLRPADVIAWVDPVRFPRFPFLRADSAARDVDDPLVPCSAEKPTGTTKRESRRDALDPAIDKAVELAGGLHHPAVWLQLKELALAGTLPFTGAVDGNALAYTSANNRIRIKWLNRDALRKRLERRLQMSGR